MTAAITRVFGVLRARLHCICIDLFGVHFAFGGVVQVSILVNSFEIWIFDYDWLILLWPRRPTEVVLRDPFLP